MKKRMMFFAALVIAATAAFCSAAEAVTFSDTAGHWAEQQIGILAAQGLIGGYPEGDFKPENQINADEFIKIAVVSVSQDVGNSEGYWAAGYIARAIELGLVDEGEYEEYSVPITRKQIAKILVRSLDEEYGDMMYVYEKLSDMNADPLYYEYVLKAVSKGIIGGYPDNTFGGGNTATRAEAAAMMLRAIDSACRLDVSNNSHDISVTDEAAIKAEFGGDFDVVLHAKRAYELFYFFAESDFSSPAEISVNKLAQFGFCHCYYDALTDMPKKSGKTAMKYREASPSEVNAALYDIFGIEGADLSQSDLYNADTGMLEMWEPNYNRNISMTVSASRSEAGGCVVTAQIADGPTLVLTLRQSGGRYVIESMKAGF